MVKERTLTFYKLESLQFKKVNSTSYKNNFEIVFLFYGLQGRWEMYSGKVEQDMKSVG